MKDLQRTTLNNSFGTTLATTAYELRKALSQIDVLNSSSRRNLLKTAEDHINATYWQHATAAGTPGSNVPCKIKDASGWSNGYKASKAVGGVLGGIGGNELLTLPIKTIEHTFSDDEHLSLLDIITDSVSESLGIDKDVVNVGVKVAAIGASALVGLVATSKLTGNFFREKIIDKIMKNFGQDTAPKVWEHFDRGIGGSKKLEWNK